MPNGAGRDAMPRGRAARSREALSAATRTAARAGRHGPENQRDDGDEDAEHEEGDSGRQHELDEPVVDRLGRVRPA